VSPKNCDVLAKLVPDAKVVWIDQSSHFAHVDTPDAVVTAVTEFFAQT
jgi:pimeloyl-ACP methyl ester carboxylesterase